ncbi:GNAT family N-acetyltransferase [Aquimarina sp. ERC-38]|uniref:GNAT family N-acetyltransferase n=1 Tax=Aquimarina sp. ERC-38 TaxID=2949996 RepID=UPI0022452456|nr:GNAT family protein [Aquimarina sp. ERC-38]UZO81833.1 GNAT family N-acetyltransferase [Aquimarina sp. ERC-38]
MKLEVKEAEINDFERIISYFHTSNNAHFKLMGADKLKLPNPEDWNTILKSECKKPNTEKKLYYIIWLLNNQPIGHSNINNINYRKEANMHLHVWEEENRSKGLGFQFLEKTIPYYFINFKLQKLLCEPNAYNKAPNKTLIKLGFDKIKTYETIPGSINFKQDVTRYELTHDRFKEIWGSSGI